MDENQNPIDTPVNKEKVYDETLWPLMERIIETCKEHEIPMLCHFEIPTPSTPGLICLTAMCDPEWSPSPELVLAFRILDGESTTVGPYDVKPGPQGRPGIYGRKGVG
ncbi:MAG TPA: hypothetical protein VM285_03065 [Polyangia bacterium]|nr:hypothetical protein [Polyangia bacterium]